MYGDIPYAVYVCTQTSSSKWANMFCRLSCKWFSVHLECASPNSYFHILDESPCVCVYSLA